MHNYPQQQDYTIEKFNKGLKLHLLLSSPIFYYTIEKFNKGLKRLLVFSHSF